jgi:hypothetical protein
MVLFYADLGCFPFFSSNFRVLSLLFSQRSLIIYNVVTQTLCLNLLQFGALEWRAHVANGSYIHFLNVTTTNRYFLSPFKLGQFIALLAGKGFRLPERRKF